MWPPQWFTTPNTHTSGAGLCPAWRRPCAHWVLLDGAAAAAAAQGNCKLGPLCPILTPIGPAGTWAPQLSAEPHCPPVGVRSRWQCWRLPVTQGSLDNCAENLERSRRTPSFLGRAVAQPPPIMLRVLCGNRARIPGPCTYSYKSACLLFGCRARCVSLWAWGNGGCVRVQEGVPASGVGAATPPCQCRLCAPTAASSGALIWVQDTEEESLVTV